MPEEIGSISISDNLKFDSADSIKAAAALWQKELDEAKSLVCTASTVQDVKKKRSELTKKFNAAEDMRKAYKKSVMAEYDAKEAVYNENFSNPYKDVDQILWERIDAVESELKSACEKRLRAYFAELCQKYRLGWLQYHRAGITVDLTSAKQKTPQKLMDRIAEFVARVATERDAINRLPDADEIMVEFQKTLSMASAVETVRRRHEEMARVRQAAQQNAAAEAVESAAVARVEAAAPVVVARAEPVQTPRSGLVQSEQLLPCTFTVKATKSKLIKLRNFLKQEEIHYVCK